MVQGFHAIYNFIIYLSGEIGKHNFTIKLWYFKQQDAFILCYKKTVSKIWSRFKRVPFIVRAIIFLGMIVYFIANAVKIRIREREAL